MTLEDIGEFGFIQKISRGCLIRPENVIKSIGFKIYSTYGQ